MTAFLDLFADETGAAPSGWTKRFSTANYTLTGEPYASGVTNGSMRLAITANGPRMVSLDALGTSTDCEALTRFKLTSVSTVIQSSTMQAGLMLRASGSAGSEIGYAAVLMSDADNNGSHIRLARYSPGGTVATLGSDVAFPWAVNTTYRIRFRVIGTGNPTVQIRIWADNVPEPTAWTIDHVDSGAQRITTSGWGGAFAFGCAGSSGTATWDYDWITFATAGEQAQTPATRGAVYFNGAAGSAGPQQCTQRWVTANTAFTENASGFFRMANTTATGRHLLSLDMIPASADIDLQVKVRVSAVTASSAHAGAVVRGSGAAAAENGYGAILADAAGTKVLRLSKYVAGVVSNVVADVAYTWAANEYHQIRLRVIGTNLKVKAWKDSDPEPSLWTIGDPSVGLVTDSSVTAAGWNGPYSFAIANCDYDFVGWGTDGDPAGAYSSAVIETFNGANNAQPVNWRRNWVMNATTMNEVDGGFLRMAVATQARNSLFWDAIEASSANIELLVKARASAKVAAQPSWQIFLRGSGAAGAENGYRFGLFEPAGAELRVAKYTAGAAANIGTDQAFTWAVDTWYWMRCRVNGTTLTLKVWADGDPEPSSPQRTETDSAFSAAGMNGVMGFVVGNIDVDYASYALAGGVAPGPTANASVSSAVAVAQSVAISVTDRITASQAIVVGQSAAITGPATITASEPIVIVQTATIQSGASRVISAVSHTISIVQTASVSTDITSGRNASAAQTVFAPQVAYVRTVAFVRPLIGTFYAQGDPFNVSNMDAFLGWNIPLAFEFAGFVSKADLQGGLNSLSNNWKNYNTANPTKQRRLFLSLPTSTNDLGLSDALLAGGTTQDAFIDSLAQRLIADGHEDALIRFWEMNGGWYPWGNTWTPNFTPAPATNAAAVRKVVDRFRAQAGQAFEFVWSPAIGFLQSPPANYYPGDAYIDWIAPDVYGQVYKSANRTPVELWERDTLGYDVDHTGGQANTNGEYEPYGLLWFKNEARDRSKKFGVGECGIGWSPDTHGFGDAGWWWQRINDYLQQYGPATGALLGVFDQNPGDYWSEFSFASNYRGTVPSPWYRQKIRTAFAFRHFFGDGVLPDLSVAGFEANPPTGMGFALSPDYGSGASAVIPLGTPGGIDIGRITVTGGERVWAADVGESDGTSTTFPRGLGSQLLAVAEGLFGSAEDGGRLIVRSGKANALLTGKKQVLGTSNALGGLNFDLNVAVTRVTVAGSPIGFMPFGAASSARPVGTTPRWNGDGAWIDSAVASGFGRINTTVGAARRALAIADIGAVANIDITTSMRTSVVPALTSAYTIGGLIVRGDGISSAETGYIALLGALETSPGSGVFQQRLIVRKYLNGTLTDIASSNFSFAASTLYQIRFQASGTTSPVVLRAKVWLATDPEPAGWTIDTTDTTSLITAAGWAGMFAFYWQTGGVSIDYDYLSWNTTGASSVPSAASAASASQAITLGQSAIAATGAAVTVGGIAIGSAGTGIYAGFDLIWGDDFDTMPGLWTFRNLTGKWLPAGRAGDRRFNAHEKQIFLDASYRGPRNESPTDLGINPFSVASSVLSMTAAVRDSALDTHVPYNMNGGVIDAMDNQGRPVLTSGALRSHPEFMLSVEGDFMFEAKIELAAGTINGYWPGLPWISGLLRSAAGEDGEIDLVETWAGASRLSDVSLHVPLSTPGLGATQQVLIVDDRALPTGRQVQVVLRKQGNTLTYWDDFASAGTLVQIATYTNTRVSYLRGAHAYFLSLAVATDVLPGSGAYSAAHWPKPAKVDWVRAWVPTGAQPASRWTELGSISVSPGGSWAASFPAIIWPGYTPDREDVLGLFDNEDNPGQLIRSTSNDLLPGGMSVNMTARTVTGTVPMGEGGRTGLLFAGSKATGGAAKTAILYWNVAPAVQPSLFPDCFPAIGETFSRTVAYTDFHSGNLGPHTYTVTKLSGGTDLTITGNGTGSVTIAGTLATAQVTVLQIVCTNAIGQTTSITRTITAATRPFHWDFRYGKFRHGSTNYADFPAAITAGKATYTVPLVTNATIYSQGLDTALAQMTVANTPRISDRGLNYDGQVTNMMGGALAADARVKAAVTVTADVMTGPSGSVNGDRVIEDATTNSHYVSSRTGGVAYTAGTSYFGCCYVKQGSVRNVQAALTDSAFPAGQAYINIDTLRGTITKAGTAVTLSGIEWAHFLGKGWLRAWFFATATTTASGANGLMAGFINDDPLAGKQPSYAGNIQRHFFLWGVSLEARLSSSISFGLPVFLNNNEATSISVVKNADAMQALIETGCDAIRIVFDDGSTQDYTGLSLGLFSVPTTATTLQRRFVREIYGFAGVSTLNATAGQPIVIAQTVAITSTPVSPRNITAPQAVIIPQLTAVILGALPVGPIRSAIGGLNPQAIVEMFEYDDRGIGGFQVVRWHDGTTIMDQPITWQGVVYNPMPIFGDGFQLQLQGTLPRPTLRASNISGSLGAYLRTMQDSVGAKITRRRTLARYMDAVNFPAGNPNADPTAAFPDDVFFVSRKSSENAIFIELELSVSYDVIGVQLPRRQVIAGTCLWVYRSPDCGYSGPPVQTIEGEPTSNPALDRCRKTLSACKARFGTLGTLNTSAFPASSLISGG